MNHDGHDGAFGGRQFTQTRADVRFPQSLLHPSVESGFTQQSGALVGIVNYIKAKRT